MTLLHEIQDGATEDSVSLATLLRKLKLLASRLGVKEIVEWVNQESQGYKDDENLPPYRGPFEARVVGDVAGPFGSGAKNLPFPKIALPEKLHDGPLFKLYFMQGVAELEALTAIDNPRLSWPADIVAALPIIAERDVIQFDWENYTWIAIWKIIPRTTLVGVLDAIRNRILDFSMAVEDEPATVKEQRLSEDDQERVFQIFQTTVYAGSANIALGNRDVNQTQGLPEPFDTDGLMNYLRHLGLGDNEIKMLQHALREDAKTQDSNSTKGPGRNALRWLKRVTDTSTSKIGIPVATSLIIHALLHYFGL
jgi:hypothetical protein